MVNDTEPEIDLGPLSWVQGEIDQALSRGLDALATFKASPADKTPLKQARAHVHQAAGAIQMVGLDAVAVYTEELERQFVRLDDLPADQVDAACALVDRACRKLKIFLDELVNGASPVPLRLFPEYESMQQARGVKAAAPTDLFYPDLSARAPKIVRAQVMPALKLPSFLIKQRRQYQRGLLAWLRGDEAGARVMRDAIQGIEDVQSHSAQRSFWWSVGALLESIVEQGVETSFGVKQLCGRVDLQIRRIVEGSAKIADRMRREVLYYVAISAPITPQVQAVQRGYRVTELIPSAEVLSADVVRVQPLVREARDHVLAAKDLWLKLTSGRGEHLPKLKQTLSGLRDAAAGIGNPALSRLVGALAHRVDKLAAGGIPDMLAMEYATALLLAESAVEKFNSLSPEFPKQVDAMVARLDAVQEKRSAADIPSPPVLDEMARRAQERLLLAQVAREIQINLRHIEHVLDAFFRDHGKRSELATLSAGTRQIIGALRILGLDKAEQLLELCQRQIDEYASSDAPVQNDDLEMLAESLSGLGFYIEAVEQQRPDRDRLIAPLLAKRLGEAPKRDVEPQDTVESAVADTKAALPAALASFKDAVDDPSARDALVTKLESLRSDAELLDDTALLDSADCALSLIEGGRAADAKSIDEAIADLSGEHDHPEAPAPSPETMRLMETEASQFDAELLDIYLTEADEVLDTVRTNLATLRGNAQDRDALNTVRRGFHTLKGSGRMVGLGELGDLAFAVEGVHNRVLEEDRPVTASFLEMIDLAAASFSKWLGTLRSTGRVAPDGRPLLAAVAKVEAEFPGGPDDPSGSPADTPLPVVPAVGGSVDAGAASTGPASMFMPAIEVLELEDAEPAASANDPPAAGLDAEIIEFAASDFGAHGREDPEPGSEDDEISFGGVTLSGALYRILCDEAQQHLATLASEFAILQFDPAAIPSQAMIRASHTLCGIHRTGGFPLVAATAKSLEQCLLAIEGRGSPMPGAVQPVLARAIAGLDTFVSRVRSKSAFTSIDQTDAAEIVDELETLRLETAPGHSFDDSEAFAAQLALSEDDESASASHQKPVELFLVPAGPADDPIRFGTADDDISIEIDYDTLEQDASLDDLSFDASLFHRAEAPLPPVLKVVWNEHGPGVAEAVPPAIEAPVVAAEPLAIEAAAEATEAELQSPEAELQDAEAASQDADAAPQDAGTAAQAVGEASRAVAAGHPDELTLQRAARLHKVVEVAAQEQEPGSLAAVAESTATAPPASAVAANAPALAVDSPPPETVLAAPRPDTPAVLIVADPLAGLRDDVDPQLLPVFLEEGAELFPRAGEELRAWSRKPAEREPPQSLQRTLHTLKGSARMAGAMRLGELTHHMETRLVAGDTLSEATPALFEALEADLDNIAFLFDRLQKGELNVELPGAARSAAVRHDATADAPAAPASANNAPQPLEAEATQRAMLRVRADLVDRLVNEAGEVAIARARVEGELRALKGNLLELTNSVIRLRSQVREIEIQAESEIQSHMVEEPAEGFDPLEFDRYTRFQELTRGIAEGVNDVSTVQQALLKNLDDADVALLAQARLSREVQQQLFSIRTVPFASVSERLYRILRQTAKELDKRANLDIKGAQVELDRSVLEKLVGSLEHLLRNALDHGIEGRDARTAAGKAETGELTLEVRQQGNEIVIALSDDGAGIDYGRIREKAIAQGLVVAGADPSDARLLECIFAPGFSTASHVTRISGRGVGMDVVRNDVAALGGRIDVTSVQGKGSTFILTLPLTLAVAQAVLVRAGGRLWALPSPMVEQVQQIKEKDLIDLYSAGEVVWQGRKYPFFYLPRLLGDAAHNPEILRYNPVILLRSGQSVAAVHVDAMMGNQEIVVKNIGPQLARVTGIAGATVLGTGEVVLIINVVQLAQRADVADRAYTVIRTPQAIAAAAAAARASGPPLVMVVDDSLTIRKITSRLLVREGFEVLTAKDGLDALQMLGERVPDVILLDIEMPHMDGFEFAKTARNDPKSAHIPIIMITSRTADKHRARAAELGVERYLGKPYQEDELLKSVRELLALHTA